MPRPFGGPLLYVAASLLALFVGPLLLRLAAQARGLGAAIDGFVLVALGGLVLLHLLPEALEHAGGWALGAAFAGALLPLLIEGPLARGARPRRVVWVAMLALAAHALVDGGALAGAERSPALALGVVLHRLPVGLFVWWVVRPLHGPRVAWGALGVVSAATLIGLAIGTSLHGAAPAVALGAFDALVGGSLLHVLLHEVSPRGLTHHHGAAHASETVHADPDCAHAEHAAAHVHVDAERAADGAARAGALGAALGFGVVGLVTYEAHGETALEALRLVERAAPGLLGAVLLAGLARHRGAATGGLRWLAGAAAPAAVLITPALAGWAPAIVVALLAAAAAALRDAPDAPADGRMRATLAAAERAVPPVLIGCLAAGGLAHWIGHLQPHPLTQLVLGLAGATAAVAGRLGLALAVPVSAVVWGAGHAGAAAALLVAAAAIEGRVDHRLAQAGRRGLVAAALVVAGALALGALIGALPGASGAAAPVGVDPGRFAAWATLILAGVATSRRGPRALVDGALGAHDHGPGHAHGAHDHAIAREAR